MCVRRLSGVWQLFEGHGVELNSGRARRLGQKKEGFPERAPEMLGARAHLPLDSGNIEPVGKVN